MCLIASTNYDFTQKSTIGERTHDLLIELHQLRTALYSYEELIARGQLSLNTKPKGAARS